MTFVEGMGRPLGGDVAMKYLHNMTGNDAIAPSIEDVQARQNANPGIAAAGEVVGNIAGMKGVGQVLPEFERLGKVGSAALKSAIEMMAMSGSEEINNHIVKTPPPDESASDVLAHLAYSGIMGGVTGGIFGSLEMGANKGLKALDNAKIVDNMKSWLGGYGASVEGMEKPIYDPFLKEYVTSGGEGLKKPMWDAGQKFQKNLPDIIAKQAIDWASRGAAYHAEGLYGIGASKLIEPYIEKVLQKPLSYAARKTVVPIINKVMTSGMVQAAPQALEYAINSAKGAQKVTHGMNMLFNSGTHAMYDDYIDPKKRKQIEDGIDDSILDQQLQNQQSEENQPQEPMYAEGGEVRSQNTDHFANLMPQENMILQSAKSRVYNYLKGLKPQNKPGLAFDSKNPNKEQHRKYGNALDLATNPLSILSHAKSGTITSEHVQHMTSMWPELSNHLSKKIQERITMDQLEGKKPNYKTRQGLSMLLGQPLESVMAPIGIQSAQSVFIPKAPNTPAQGQGKLQRGTSKLGSKTNNMYKTSVEAAEEDTTDRS